MMIRLNDLHRWNAERIRRDWNFQIAAMNLRWIGEKWGSGLYSTGEDFFEYCQKKKTFDVETNGLKETMCLRS